jgi:protein-S-isoprenylcysteine O-methyltransferase Ste14
MKGALIGFAVLSFLLYGRAIRHTFSRDHGVNRRMRMLEGAGVLSALIHVAALAVTPLGGGRGALALGLYLGALGVFGAAKRAVAGYCLTLAFSPDVPAKLLSTGIYGYVRHPFYLAYSLTWLAGCVGAPAVATAVTAALMIGSYVYAAKEEEAKFKQSPVAASYESYRSRAGFLWPRFGRSW